MSFVYFDMRNGNWEKSQQVYTALLHMSFANKKLHFIRFSKHKYVTSYAMHTAHDGIIQVYRAVTPMLTIRYKYSLLAF